MCVDLATIAVWLCVCLFVCCITSVCLGCFGLVDSCVVGFLLVGCWLCVKGFLLVRVSVLVVGYVISVCMLIAISLLLLLCWLGVMCVGGGGC